jgi:hypothetical protein
MFEERENETTFEYLLRIVARGASVVCLAIILLFFLGQDFALGSLSATEWVGFAFFPAGVLFGLVLAWREELLGGTITLISVAGFYLVYGWLLNATFRQGWAFLPFVLPGVLFVMYGYVRAHTRHIHVNQNDSMKSS